MKRFFLFLIGAALAAVAIAYVLRLSQKTSNAAVTSLLPRETIAFAHVPDFNRTRSDWHRSDLYQLYTEPAVQEFLRKPLAHPHPDSSFSQKVRQIEQLDPKDAFVALTSMANDRPKLVAGFRFRGSQEEAERIIAEWRANLVGESARRETVEHEKHKIDIFTGGPFTIATTYNGRWFLGANDVDEIKALLDRADGRVQDRQSLLDADETFRAAMAEMPSSYALGFYLQPKVFAEKLAALRGSSVPNKRTMLEDIRCVCATTRFDNGKIHDVGFVAMPRFEQDATLTRDSAALGTKETFLYLASLLNFSRQLALIDPTATRGVMGGALDRMADALATANVSMEDWEAAFAPEIGALADWPANAHWPSGVAVFPVKDMERAKKIATVLAHASDHDAVWKETDRNGVHYLSMQSAPGFLVLRPTIAISNRLMIAGLDPGSVEAAMQRSASASSDFTNSPAYRNTTQAVPAPTHFFAYVDLALLYSRLDATLRPILMMGAAFVPGVNEHVDLSRMPPAEVVAKHLSPIVSSQTYQHNGYVTESIGPITLNHSGIALIALAAVGANQAGITNALSGFAPPSLWTPQPSASTSPTP